VIDKIHNKKMEKNKIKVGKEKILAGVVKNSDCKDRNCHIHGSLKVRGRIFEGKVTKKFHKRITIEFERMIYVRKYERYKKSKTKIHARLPICMEKDIQVGDLIKIQECRPLSKIIHFVVIEKINKEKGK
jgi:small subunit ribosomal protein S17|tara:strand:+ start:603 stop:992 length:390 start_codon:yes stop_codon:yes gene_type:complete